jgi:TonB family protein
MESVIRYLLESSVILGVLTIFYRFVLHNEPMFRFNRLYLLLSLLLAAIVPILNLSFVFYSESNGGNMVYMLDAVNVYSGKVKQTIVPVIVNHTFFNWLYLVGAVILLARLLYGFSRLGGLSRKAEWLNINGCKVANLPGRFNPFSFFHIIFVNRSLYSDDDLDKIMEHEMAHVRFKHSLDVLIIEALLIVQWFNPFAWVVQRLLKELHEFQADKEVIKKGASIGQYKMLLLCQATGARLLPVNNFNQSITKKRFKMMTNNSLKNNGFAKVLLALFVVTTVTFFFACENSSDEIEEIDSVLKSTDSGLNDELTYFIVDSMPKYPGGDLELRKYIAANIKYPQEAQVLGIQGRVYVQFVVSSEGTVEDVEVARGVNEYLDAEAIRVVSEMPDWTPGYQSGDAVNVNYTIPINFVLQGEETEETSVNEELSSHLIIIDGEEADASELKGIESNIESVNVLKGETAIKKYGDKGKGGVVEIVTKETGEKIEAVHVVGFN